MSYLPHYATNYNQNNNQSNNNYPSQPIQHNNSNPNVLQNNYTHANSQPSHQNVAPNYPSNNTQTNYPSSSPIGYPPADPNSMAHNTQVNYSSNAPPMGYPPADPNSLNTLNSPPPFSGYPSQSMNPVQMGVSNYPPSPTQQNQPYPNNSPNFVGSPQQPYPNNSSIAASFFSQAPSIDPQKESNPYVIHWNKTIGIGAGIGEKGSSPSLRGFPTYEITLYFVNEIFHGKVQSWNKNYVQAQKIFGSGVAAKIARTTIRKQHDWLYRNVARRNESGRITNGGNLLDLIENGRLQNGFILFYTYVIVDNIWRFSQTGKSTLKDFMSKHAAHAACKTEVTYSGEFHIQRSVNGRFKLILDNNSGTYAPDKNDLPKLVQLFQRNFPGLEVEALHYADPLLKQYLDIATSNNALLR